MRDHHPVTAQVRTRDFWMRPSSTSSISPNLLKSTFATATCPGYRRQSPPEPLLHVDSFFHVSLNVFAQDTTFTARPFTFARLTPNSRARRRISGARERKRRFQQIQICLRLSQPSCCWSFSFCCRSRRCRFLFRGAAAGAAPSTSKIIISEPVSLYRQR